MSGTRKPTPDKNFEHLLTLSNEEIAERDAAAREKNKGFPKVEFGADETDKRTLGFDPWSEIDPMTAALQSIPGGPKADRAYKLCSNNSATLLGGHMGYAPERDAESNVIQIGNMFVGSIPKHVAENRKKLNAMRAEEQIRDKEEEYMERVEDLKAQASDLGMALQPMGYRDRSQRTRASRAKEELGITVDRGTEIQ